MSITSYATLKTEVASWLHRDDLTSFVPTFIQFAQNRIYRDLRVKALESAFSTAISSGVIALPTRYRELKYAYVDGSPTSPLLRKDAEWIYANYPTRSSGGQPKFIAREGDTFIFGPYPDSAYTIKGVAYCGLAALSVDGDTNWLITDAPALLLFASLCEAGPYMMDDSRVALWEQKYEKERARIQREDDEEEFSGSILSISGR